MINFEVDNNYILDLKDDFVINEKLTLYDFIGKDPVKAFYLGYYLSEWIDKIDRNQQYLYTKQARHNKDDLEKYQSQLDYWSKKYPEQGEVDMVKLAEYLINNIIWDPDTEEADIIKMSFFFGNMVSLKRDGKDNN